VSSDHLVQELKARLKVEDVVATYGAHAQGELKGRGRELCGAANDSLKVYPYDQAWRWYSAQIDRKQDALSWIAYSKFGRTAVDGADFADVLRIACGLCGIDYEAHCAKSKGGNAKATTRRKLEDILERYVALSESLRDAEFYVRVRQIGRKTIEKNGEKIELPGKTWLTKEICERWRLGPAPTFQECERAGVSADDLKAVCLYRCSQGGEWYMFFRDAMIIPTMRQSRVLYLSSRVFKDFKQDGTPKDKKTLHMPTGDLTRPAAFNLDCLNDPETREKGVWMVEGPLDAIACCERGQPSLALYGATPGDELAKILKRSA
jgi:DNA primase